MSVDSTSSRKTSSRLSAEISCVDTCSVAGSVGVEEGIKLRCVCGVWCWEAVGGRENGQSQTQLDAMKYSEMLFNVLHDVLRRAKGLQGQKSVMVGRQLRYALTSFVANEVNGRQMCC